MVIGKYPLSAKNLCEPMTSGCMTVPVAAASLNAPSLNGRSVFPSPRVPSGNIAQQKGFSLFFSFDSTCSIIFRQFSLSRRSINVSPSNWNTIETVPSCHLSELFTRFNNFWINYVSIHMLNPALASTVPWIGIKSSSGQISSPDWWFITMIEFCAGIGFE